MSARGAAWEAFWLNVGPTLLREGGSENGSPTSPPPGPSTPKHYLGDGDQERAGLNRCSPCRAPCEADVATLRWAGPREHANPQTRIFRPLSKYVSVHKSAATCWE